jgi:hypothetical protein
MVATRPSHWIGWLIDRLPVRIGFFDSSRCGSKIA